MQLNGFNHINPEQWRNLLRSAQASKGPHRKYVVLKEGEGYSSSVLDEKTKKLPISEIVDISKRKFDQAKFDVQDLTHENVKNFTALGSSIATYTDKMIEARQTKRDQPLKKIVRGVALVLSALASLALIGIPFFILLRQGNKKFESEMNKLKANVQAMRQEIQDLRNKKFELDKKILMTEFGYEPALADQLLKLEDDIPELIDRIHELKAQIEGMQKDDEKLPDLVKRFEEAKEELKSYLKDIQGNEKALGISFEKAAKYVHLKKAFHDIEIPFLNGKAYAGIVQNVINGIFNDQLETFFNIPQEKRPAVMEQFAKDMPRKNTFLRSDKNLGIHDQAAHPTPVSKAKISDAAIAIAQLIKTEKDQDWIPVLQLAVSQTNLNGAFLRPRVELTELGSKVTWDEEGKDDRVMPEFPDQLPPVQLEIIRDKDGSIQQVKVLVEGSLNLVKRDVSRGREDPQNDRLMEKEQVIVEGAVKTSLSYTLTLEDNRPVINDFKCENTTNIPRVGESISST